jgi:Tyrosine-protein kinase ephrin type A/B receptor-like
VCLPCKAGTVNPLSYSDNEDACSPCDLGSYNPSTAQATCLKCPSGYEGIEVGTTTLNAACIECPAGSSQPLTGQPKGSCTPCMPGTWASKGASTCSLCAISTWSTTNATTCTACPNHTSTASIGAASLAECTATAFVCPAGQQTDLLTGKCIPLVCNSPLVFNAKGTACTGCPAQSTRTLSGDCVPCAPGNTCLGILSTPVFSFSTLLATSKSSTSGSTGSRARRASSTLESKCFSWSVAMPTDSLLSNSGSLSSFPPLNAPSNPMEFDSSSIVAIIVGSALAIFLVLSFTLAHRWNSATFSKPILDWYASQDMYNLQHVFWTAEGESQERRQTSFGGLMSILSFVAIAIIALVLIFTYLSSNNRIITTALNVLNGNVLFSAISIAWASGLSQGEKLRTGAVFKGIEVRVFAAGDAGMCTAPISWIATGLSAGSWKLATTPACADGSSLMVFSCEGCLFTPESSLTASYHFSCQALLLEVAAKSSDSSTTAVTVDPSLTSASLANGPLASVAFSLQPMLTVMDATSSGYIILPSSVKPKFAVWDTTAFSPAAHSVVLSVNLPLSNQYTAITTTKVTTAQQLLSSIIGLLALMSTFAGLLATFELCAANKRIGRFLHRNFRNYPYHVLLRNETIVETEYHAPAASSQSNASAAGCGPVDGVTPHDLNLRSAQDILPEVTILDPQQSTFSDVKKGGQ